MTSNIDGVWAQGWAASGKRVAAWHHHTGALWAWSWDGARFALEVRPVGNGDSKPPGTDDLESRIPLELRKWAWGA